LQGKIQLFSTGGPAAQEAGAPVVPVFKYVKPEEAAKCVRMGCRGACSDAGEHRFKGLSAEETLVFHLIQNAANMGACRLRQAEGVPDARLPGIWTKDLKARSNLMQPTVTKCLKALEARQLVKAVKSVASSNRKVYMLFELEPSREVTGGAWYTGHEYDTEFITALRTACADFIKQQGCTTVDAVHDYVTRNKVSKVDLSEDEVLQVVNTLVYDGRVDSHEARPDDRLPYPDGTVYYRPAAIAPKGFSDFTLVPCGVCPVASDCHDGGKISPATCVYLDAFLAQTPAAAGGAGGTVDMEDAFAA